MAEGWDDVFLDLDPLQGIAPGARWEAELYRQSAECEAVIFLVSQNWLASDWRRREYELARKLNKRPFIALLDDIAIDELPPFLKDTHQAVRLDAGADHIVFSARMPVTHEVSHVTFSEAGPRAGGGGGFCCGAAGVPVVCAIAPALAIRSSAEKAM